MSVAVVLPARLAASRLPNKLLLDRTGRSVLEHTVARALAAKERSGGLIRAVLVACDDEKLAEAARRAGVEAVLTDPKLPSGTDRIAVAAKDLPDTIIVNLQADEPELDPAAVLQVASILNSDTDDAQMATLAVPIFNEAQHKNPNVVKVVADAKGRALYFSRAPIPFAREPEQAAALWSFKDKAGKPKRVYGLHHLGLYAYRKDFLLNYRNLPDSRLEKLEKLEQLRAIEAGHTILLGLAASNPPGIDTPEDYEAFVKRWQAGGGGKGGAELEDFQADWLDRGATFYGH